MVPDSILLVQLVADVDSRIGVMVHCRRFDSVSEWVEVDRMAWVRRCSEVLRHTSVVVGVEVGEVVVLIVVEDCAFQVEVQMSCA